MNLFFARYYCQLVWMILSRFNKSKVRSLHEICLRLMYNGKTPSYKEVMEKDGSVSIHYKQIQVFAVKMFKIKNGTYPVIVSDIFLPQRGNHNNLRLSLKTFVYLLYGQYIMAVKAYRIKTKIFSKRFYRIYQIIATFTLSGGCVKLM